MPVSKSLLLKNARPPVRFASSSKAMSGSGVRRSRSAMGSVLDDISTRGEVLRRSRSTVSRPLASTVYTAIPTPFISRIMRSISRPFSQAGILASLMPDWPVQRFRNWSRSSLSKWAIAPILSVTQMIVFRPWTLASCRAIASIDAVVIWIAIMSLSLM